MKKIFLFGEPAERGNYIAALESCGVQVTASTDPNRSAGCDALLLPGGGDLDPALFGEENWGSLEPNRQLDLTEIELALGFCEAGKPIFGICRGM